MDVLNLNIFDSDEDEDIDYVVLHRLPKIFNDRPNYFEIHSHLEFFKRFRLQKRTCAILLSDIEDKIKSATLRNNAIAPASKLLLTLRFYATGNVLISVGNFVVVSKTSACCIVTQVTDAIASLRKRYIKFPEVPEDLQKTKTEFYLIAKFPNVIGAIDCTRVRIQSPGGNEAERYRNRKGYFSLNVQTICDARLYILDIVARWPGSTHDQTIFNNSRIKGRLQNKEFGRNSVILGDSGYANTNFLITPLEQPNSQAETLFNESQIRTRNCVGRSYGIWKRRFPILSLGMRVSPEHSQAIIVAAAVLYNLAIQEREDAPPDEVVVQDVEQPVLPAHHQEVAQNNNQMRTSIILNHSANL